MGFRHVEGGGGEQWHVRRVRCFSGAYLRRIAQSEAPVAVGNSWK